MKPLIGFIAWVVIIFGGAAPIPNSSAKINFVVPQGQSAGQIIQSLSSQNLIKSKTTTKIYLKLTGLDQKIIPGSYILSPGQNLPETVTALTSGPKDIWVTFPEGWRREQMAARLEKNITGFNSEEFITKTASLEGTLFPDTYLISPQASVDDVISMLTTNFAAKTKLDFKLLEDRRILIIASIIERESRSDVERPVISGIFNNRLGAGWPLELDATVQYARDTVNCQKNKTQCKYWQPLLDTKLPSVFNTYLHVGLPPTPICNPGLSSIQAAKNPEKTSYWFYIHDTSGEVHYARTNAEHNLNIDKYLRP